MFISVVMSNYNMGTYLSKAMNSLLAQSYSNFEIIIVNDGSTDGSQRICDEYARNYDFISVIHKENGGLSSARNAGIDAAHGEYIVFPDPDDWFDPDYLSRLASLQKKYPAALVCTGHYVTTPKAERRHIVQDELRIYSQTEALHTLMQSSGFCGFAWNKLYKLSIILENNLRFDSELGMAQDLHFAYRYLCLCDQVVYDTHPTYHYFQHPGGVTNAGLTPRKVSGLKTYEKIHQLAKEAHPQVADMALATLANLSLSMLEKYYDGTVKDKALLQTLRKNIRTYSGVFLKSKEHSATRKAQLALAKVWPKGYYFLRKAIR